MKLLNSYVFFLFLLLNIIEGRIFGLSIEFALAAALGNALMQN